MLAPANLRGFKYTHNNEGDSVSYLGLSLPLNSIDNNVLSVISATAECILSNNLSYQKEKDGFSANHNNCKLYFNKEGYLTTLQYNEIILKFYDYK